LLFNKLFPIVYICLRCEDMAGQVMQLCADGDFLCHFCASRVQQILDVHSKFSLRLHHVQKYGMVDIQYIQSATAEMRRGKNNKERNHRGKI